MHNFFMLRFFYLLFISEHFWIIIIYMKTLSEIMGKLLLGVLRINSALRAEATMDAHDNIVHVRMYVYTYYNY